jgi:PilZ domain
MEPHNTENSLVAAQVPQERRSSRRVNIDMPLLARPFHPEYKEEVQTTSNTSRDGLYFHTPSKHYCVGMRVSVILGYGPDNRYNSPAYGQVVRIDRLKDGGLGVAVQIQMR